MSGLICPHCGIAVDIGLVPVRIKVLPNVEGYDYLSSDIKKGKLIAYAVVDSYTNPDYAIFECQACSKKYVATKEDGKDWVASFPIPEIRVSEYIPDKIKSALKEARLCYIIKSYQACILMCRTALIRLQREQDVENLKSLQEQGKISVRLFQMAEEVRLWANVIGHNDVLPDVISQDDCEELLLYMESLLNEVYVTPAKLKQLTDKRKSISKEQKQT